MPLTKEQILSAEDIRTIEVDVPEWGGAVRLASMTAATREAYELQQIAIRDGKAPKVSVRALLACHSIVDDTGAPMFTAADIATLEAKSGAALARVFDAALTLQGLGAAAAEDAAKN